MTTFSDNRGERFNPSSKESFEEHCRRMKAFRMSHSRNQGVKTAVLNPVQNSCVTDTAAEAGGAKGVIGKMENLALILKLKLLVFRYPQDQHATVSEPKRPVDK